jgi:hypothetical protein
MESKSVRGDRRGKRKKYASTRTLTSVYEFSERDRRKERVSEREEEKKQGRKVERDGK